MGKEVEREGGRRSEGGQEGSDRANPSPSSQAKTRASTHLGRSLYSCFTLDTYGHCFRYVVLPMALRT